MSQEPYPKEIAKEDLLKFVAKAEKVRRKATILTVSVGVIDMAVGLVLLPVFLSFSILVVISSPPPLPAIATVAIILTIFFLSYLVFSLYFVWFLEWAGKKIFKLKYEDWVFSECIIVANSLVNNDRKKAIKEVESFTASLWSYQYNALYNSVPRRYTPEIHLLSKGKNQIKRMFLFSEEKIPELLISFGLAFVNDDHPLAYRFLKRIIQATEKYGKIEGLWQRTQSKVSNLYAVLLVLSVAVGVVVSVLTTLKVLGYI